MSGAPPLELWPPSRASYTITTRLGAGTFGCVFRARRRAPEEKQTHVALKLVPRYTFESSRELEVMRLLRERPHACVMQLQEYFFTKVQLEGESDGRFLTCMVLPLCDSSLREWLPRKLTGKSSAASVRLATLQQVGEQLSSALSHIHAMRICHRDVKPENLMVCERGGGRVALMLGDFGSAKLLGAEEAGAAGADGGSNTPYVCTRPYRAPELFFGMQGYRFAPDVWSLGCVLAEVVLCGQQLFDAETAGYSLLSPKHHDARSAAQLHLLISCLGTPTDAEILDMNPALAGSSSFDSWRELLERQPARPLFDWRANLAQSLADCGGTRESVELVTQLLDAIFLYSPQRRLSAEECRARLSSMPFGP